MAAQPTERRHYFLASIWPDDRLPPKLVSCTHSNFASGRSDMDTTLLFRDQIGTFGTVLFQQTDHRTEQPWEQQHVNTLMWIMARTPNQDIVAYRIYCFTLYYLIRGISSCSMPQNGACFQCREPDRTDVILLGQQIVSRDPRPCSVLNSNDTTVRW